MNLQYANSDMFYWLKAPLVKPLEVLVLDQQLLMEELNVPLIVSERGLEEEKAV